MEEGETENSEGKEERFEERRFNIAELYMKRVNDLLGDSTNAAAGGNIYAWRTALNRCTIELSALISEKELKKLQKYKKETDEFVKQGIKKSKRESPTDTYYKDTWNDIEREYLDRVIQAVGLEFCNKMIKHLEEWDIQIRITLNKNNLLMPKSKHRGGLGDEEKRFS